MVTMRARQRATTSYAAIGAVGALVLAGCAESGAAGGGGEGPSVDYGASIEEYQAAFEDVEPIELTTQSPAPQGSISGRNIEEYFDAVTEWSGGTITFDVAYSNAVVEPEDADDALLDGRLDLAQILPIYEPAEYPANNALIEASFLSDHSVVTGTMQSNAWPLEVAFDTPEIMQEFEDNGMHVLMPSYNSGSNALMCGDERSELSDFSGMQAAAGGQGQSAHVESLGGTPVSVAYPELYESLQRGVIDCSVSSLTVGVLGGFIEAAPEVVLDPEAGFSQAPGAMAFSQASWDTLPLAAQQLLWDRMDVFFESNIEDKIWPNIVDASEQVSEAGGSIETFDEDARASIDAASEELLDEMRSESAMDDGDAFVNSLDEATERWSRIIEDDLEYTNEADYNDFADWYSEDAVDLEPFTDRVFEEILLEHRPS